MAKIDDLNKEIAELRKQLGLVKKEPFLTSQIKDARIELRGLKAEFNDLNSDIKDLNNEFKNILTEFQSANAFINLTKGSFKGLVSITEKLRGVQRTGNLLSEKELQDIRARADLEKRNLEFIIQYGNLRGADLDNAKRGLEAINGEQSEFNTLLRETEDFQSKITDNFGVKMFGSISSVVKSIPGLSGLSAPFEAAAAAAVDASKQNAVNEQFAINQTKAAEAQREADLESLRTGKDLNKDTLDRLGLESDLFKFRKDGNVKLSSLAGKDIDGLMSKVKPVSPISPKSVNVAAAGMKSIAASLTKPLGPIALLMELGKAFLAADKESVKLQKTTGKTAAEARQFQKNMNQAASMSGDLAITGAKLLESFHAINQELGVIANLQSEVLVTTAKLAKHMETSAAAQANIAASIVVSEASAENITAEMATQVGLLETEYGTRLNLASIIEETGNVTGQLRANLGGSVTEITKAVAEARLLGTSLDKIAAAGKNLLDFETAIRNEMEAEALIGRDLDLSRAKEAALMGDQVTLMKELSEQAGSFEDFANMNVIAQEKFATALGMGTDELADMLFNQDMMNKSREEMVALVGEERVAAAEAKTAQDKLNQSLAQIGTIFKELAVAFLPVFQLLGGIGTIIGGIIGFIKDLINGVGYLFGFTSDDYEFGDSAGLSTLQAGFGNFTGEAGKDANLLNDGIITPDGRIIETNPRDFIIATQDPGGLAGAQQNEALAKAMGVTNSLLEKLLAKESNIFMDGNKVGTSLSLTTVVQ